MKSHQVAILALRLLGIFCFIQAISDIPFLVSISYSASQNVNLQYPKLALMLEACAPFALHLVIGVILLACATPLARLLARSDSAQQNLTATSFEQVQLLVIGIAGIVIFASSLPQTFGSLFSLFDKRVVFSVRPEAMLIGNILRTTLGGWMFLGAQSFASFWQSFGAFNNPKASPDK